jgi:la-related protein 1
MSAVSPTGPGFVANEAPYPIVNAANGDHSSGLPSFPMSPTDDIANGSITEGSNGSIVPNGHPIGATTETVSGEPDSFSDEQVQNLTVIVRKQDQSKTRPLPPAASRTFSNGTIDSRSSLQDETEQITGQQASLKVNGTGPSQG